MTALSKPEDLAYETAALMGQAAQHTLKKRAATTLGVVGVSLGIAFFAPQSLMASIALITTYCLWDMKKGRDETKTLRDGFNMVAQGLSGHDSVYQMEPLKKVCDKIKGFNKDDLNIVEHFNQDRANVLFIGMMALISPVLTPALLAGYIAMRDNRTLCDIRDSARQTQINLQKKYPDRFPSVT